MKPSLRHGSLAGLLLVFVLAGCSAKHFRKSADREVYGVIKAKTPLVQNMATNFTIEQTNLVLLEKYPISTNVLAALGPDGQREGGARIVRLEDALAIGVKCSRKYQFEKERLYLSALDLTLVRHLFTPIFSAQGNVRYEVDKVVDDSNPRVSDHLVEEQKIRSQGNFVRADWLLGSVGKITTAVTADFLRFVSGDRGFVTSTSVGATFTRPLLQNAGFKRERETLTQSERNLLYDLRNFTQFRKDFSVQIATAYYGVLGRRDTVRNSYANLLSSRQNAERGRALAQEGRLTQSDLGRYEQQELSAESSWINAVRNYKQDLDNFKLLLGLSIDVNLVLDDRELQALRILDPNLPVDDSIQVALAARFDYLNFRDELQDAERKVALAANFLKPRIDLDADVAIASRQGSSFRAPDPSRYTYSAGLRVDPGLDRVAERNAYRAALIARDRVARDLAQQEDDIKLQVRDSWRTLDQAKRSYEISEIGVKIAERRVEEQNLLAELGRARAQDQVDAQNALIDSKNQRTQALITHTNARLQFWNRLGILYIKDNGQWEETQDAKAK